MVTFENSCQTGLMGADAEANTKVQPSELKPACLSLANKPCLENDCLGILIRRLNLFKGHL